MKKILGLDLGTNSIGWALVENNFEEKAGNIIGMGSRIIPIDQGSLGEFDRGNSISQTADRTGFRGVRRLRERYLLRRERLHSVLNILGFLPDHYSQHIDFEKHFGQFLDEAEPKLAYKPNPETGKADFIFKSSFEEMLADFSKRQPQLLTKKNGDPALIPYDWTIYYLRKKALTQRIEKEELAWLLLHFNQKRGYYQLRDEEDENKKDKIEEVYTLKIIDVVEGEKDKKNKDAKWYEIKLENGWIYKRTSKTKLDWIGKIKDFFVTTEVDENGNIKKDLNANEKRRISVLPTFEEIEKLSQQEKNRLFKKIKLKTEIEIEHSQKTVGTYIYDTLLQNPNQKIKGKLVRTIERKFYKEELRIILEKQKTFHPELQNKQFYTACLEELYKSNENHRSSVAQMDFTYLFLNDIIFYQRPLKSKKSLISNCRYETLSYKDKEGNIISVPLKCIAKSHPLYQEFRLWQFLQNLKIYQREKEVEGKLQFDVDVTSDFLKTEEDWVSLYEWLNDRKEIDQKAFLKYPAFNLKKNAEQYRWNYVEDKIYPANETRAQILTRLSKVANVPSGFLTEEIEEHLWHILYSVEDKKEIEKALKTFACKHQLGEDFVDHFIKFPPFKKDYGAYSAKAIKKLLTLMRRGKYWKQEAISSETTAHINAITERLVSVAFDKKKIEEITDDEIPKQVLKSFIDCENPHKGLNTYQACYAIYGRHSEEGEMISWKNPADIERFLRDFKQHSLRNPIVEQVITETLRVVNDIWKYYGKGGENFFDEIHIELGREMKNTAEQRKKMTEQVSESENTNLRIKALLVEMKNDDSIENVRPYSPSQQEILKIYEEGALNSPIEIPEDILKISKNAQPTPSELTRYKLWLQQKYRSPYTGDTIPLTKLFTTAYEIEHIIPQSRYFDDSMSNKVICESEVNKDKDNATAYEYIRNNPGKIIELSYGKTAKLFTVESYEDFVKNNFGKNKGKMKRLLMEDIPETFINRQLNDTRYISKLVKNLLSNIVREDGEEETTSKNVASSNGGITSILKQEWGLNDIWNDIISPRFERLNELTHSNHFGEWTNKDGKQVFQTQVPLELQKGFSKKRIDHRHHAMDALVIACATRNHINYLNNVSANSNKRYDLRSNLCFKYKTDANGNYKWMFYKPWETFTQDAKNKLLTTLISFKQNLRIINKTTNWYQKWQKDENGQLKKVFTKQEKGENWAIRKPMHKDTVAGLVNLRFQKTVSLSVALDQWEMIVDKPLKKQIKTLASEGYDKKQLLKFFKNNENRFNETDIAKVEIYYWATDNVASRTTLNETYSSTVIKSITDTGIQKILLKHLEKYNEVKDGKTIEHPELAFSPDGLDQLNENITDLNDGKFHQPIFKARAYEPRGNKFNVGYTGNKKDKYVEAAKGTNLFFAIYQDNSGKRSYESIPLNIVIERQKQGLPSVPETNEKEEQLQFYLSPNDLVYVPTEEERENQLSVDFKNLTKEQIKRVYKFVDGSDTTANFIPIMVSGLIYVLSKEDAKRFKEKHNLNYDGLLQNEYGVGSPQSKNQKTIENIMIKEVCWKLKSDRLGRIIEVNGSHI